VPRAPCPVPVPTRIDRSLPAAFPGLSSCLVHGSLPTRRDAVETSLLLHVEPWRGRTCGAEAWREPHVGTLALPRHWHIGPLDSTTQAQASRGGMAWHIGTAAKRNRARSAGPSRWVNPPLAARLILDRALGILARNTPSSFPHSLNKRLFHPLRQCACCARASEPPHACMQAAFPDCAARMDGWINERDCCPLLLYYLHGCICIAPPGPPLLSVRLVLSQARRAH
jgi:hypothetical protein